MKNISEHILDIVQNSISANSTKIMIGINESLKYNSYELIISDNGCGMDADTIKKVSDPFYTSRTTRKVGLGIPLLKQNAELTGGDLSIESILGKGTKLVAKFTKDSIDRVPSGDIAGSVVLLVASNPNIEFIYKYVCDKGEYVFDTIEIKKILGEISITQSEVRKYLKEMLEENLSALA